MATYYQVPVMNNGNPTQYRGYWISCNDQTGRVPIPISGNLGGKWLIFTDQSAIDSMWQSVRKATEEGKLGYTSKVTGQRRYAGYDENVYVIWVHTHNSYDVQDVFRVRNVLRELGFHQPLHYKTDEATQAGQFSHLGYTGISQFIGYLRFYH